jgi:hypothetical protein
MIADDPGGDKQQIGQGQRVLVGVMRTDPGNSGGKRGSRYAW